MRRIQTSLDLEDRKQGVEEKEKMDEDRKKALRLAETRSKFQSLLLNTIRLEH